MSVDQPIVASSNEFIDAVADIATNSGDIATITAAIATNTSGIAANTSAIATNTADVAAARSDFLSTVGNNPAFAAQVAAGGSIAMVSANHGVAIPLVAPRAISIGLLEWVVGVQSGNYDIAVLDASGARLWSKGSTAVPAPGQVSETVSPAVAITKGTAFRVEIAFDNTTATYKGISLALNEMFKTLTGVPLALKIDSQIPIPSPVTLGSTAALRLPLITVRET